MNNSNKIINYKFMINIYHLIPYINKIIIHKYYEITNRSISDFS